MSPTQTRLPLVLFGLSGFSALVYETVWTRQLVLVFGATVHSASTVLAAFMAGFALGALAAAPLLRRFGPPLRLYGLVELAVAGCAAAFPSAVRAILVLVEHSELPVAPLRFALSFAALLPPAALMGATFPILSEHVMRSEPGKDVGDLYAANLAGAALGAVAGSFVLFAFIGLAGAHWLAVALNVAVGAAAIAAAGAPRRAAAPARTPPAKLFWPGLVLFLSGLCGMALEVIWTRILLPSFNNSAYGFSCVLFIYLLGLGLGSWLAGRSRAGSLAFLGAAQALAGLFAFVGYLGFELSQLLQIRLADLTNAGVRPLLLEPLLEAAVILLPVATLQGLILPVAVRLLGGSQGGAAVGRLYFWNTLGAIAGALASGFWWIPAFNVQWALLIVAGISLASACLPLAREAPKGWMKAAVPAGAAAAFALACASLRGRHVPSEMLLAWVGRSPDTQARMLHYEDDLEASVAVMMRSGSRFLAINGVGVAGYTNATKMMAHIPLLLHPKAERTLVICFGVGTTFRSALKHPGRVTAVDLVPAVLSSFRFFYPDAERWASDPRAERLVNDGRNHLLRERQGYDVIIVDPSPPLYSAGTVNLYNKDFFLLGLRKLRPGGILAVWIPDYPEPEFQMVMKSFVAAMPHTQVWRTTMSSRGVLMLGSGSPIPADRALVRRRLNDPATRKDLLEFNGEFEREPAFWDLYLGPGERFRDYLAAAPEVTDDYPWIEYPYFRSKRRDYYKSPAFFDWPPYRG